MTLGFEELEVRLERMVHVVDRLMRITDLGEGMGAFLQALDHYHDNPMLQFPESLQSYVRRKTKAKARR